jgi:hypothetical protein
MKIKPLPLQNAPRQRPTWQGTTRLDALAFLLSGAACGVFFAKLIGGVVFPGADLKNQPMSFSSGQLLDVSITWALCGMLVGWQTFVFAWPLILALERLSGKLRQVYDEAGILLLATPIVLAITICFWSILAESPLFPRSGNAAWLYLAYAAAGWFMIRKKPAPW